MLWKQVCVVCVVHKTSSSNLFLLSQNQRTPFIEPEGSTTHRMTEMQCKCTVVLVTWSGGKGRR